MQTFMKKIQFTDEEIAFVMDLYARLTPDAKNRIEFLRERYLGLVEDKNFAENPSQTCDKVGEILQYLAEGMGVCVYSMHLLFLVICAPWLPDEYGRLGLDPELAVDLMKDIKYKVDECRNMHGVIGVFTWSWFHRHFLVTRFALGRFQFDTSVWNTEDVYTFGEHTIKKGDFVLRFHIPSSGPMPREERLASYKKAYEFFKPEDGILRIVCGSWLLYEGNRHVYPEGSNLYDFMDDFDLISSSEYEDVFPNAWRVFYKRYNGDTSILPRKTTLQKNYIAWLEAGNKVGTGTGVILFDGEKIINNKRDNA